MNIQNFLKTNNINGFHNNGGTDKNTEHSYCDIYQSFFNRFIPADFPSNILEIGTYKGGWAYTMHQLLPNSMIYTIDIEDNFDKMHASKMAERFVPKLADAYNKEVVSSFGDIKFDLIIEDGPHTFETQKWAIKNYVDLLKEEGLMLIEDVRKEEVNELLEAVRAGYNTREFDLRNNKGRWDDIIIAISKRELG